MPVLGTISVKNKTLIQLSEELKKILEDGGHLVKPVINIRILNSKVTILGEVSSPGTYSFTEQYISLPQALGYAGDLTFSGKRKDILLIRESEGLRTVTHVDLTTANWMNDPKYTIQPNDVIIVNPNTKKTQTSGYNIGDLSILFGISSFIISLIFLFKK
jgi:polysaccharide export outer membrane protein